jgi:hypothetical protein
MKKEPTVKMIQMSKANWQLVSHKGHVLQKNITCGTMAEALEFVRKYASSFSDWTFEVQPLKKDVDNQS